MGAPGLFLRFFSALRQAVANLRLSASNGGQFQPGGERSQSPARRKYCAPWKAQL